MATSTAPLPPLHQCKHCGKKASSSTKIRFCTRCYSVGYCSKSCQKADWLPSKTDQNISNDCSTTGLRLSKPLHEGHKFNCIPRSKPNGKESTSIFATAKSPSSSSSSSSQPVFVDFCREDGAAYLEMKTDDGSWKNAGPIQLVGNFDDTLTNSTSTGNVHEKHAEAFENFTAEGSRDNSPSPNQSPSSPRPRNNVHSKPNHLKHLPKRTLEMLRNADKSSYSYRHSPDGVDENLLIFFHGAGDTHIPFDNLGRKMELPQTAILSLSASMTVLGDGDVGGSNQSIAENVRHSSLSESSSFVTLPFGLGYTWFEEMDYESTGMALPRDHPRRLMSLRHAVEAIDCVIGSLTGTCCRDDATTHHGGNDEDDSWIPERIFLFGFSAGACLAMEVCRMWGSKGRMPLGGAICICGGVKTRDSPRIATDDDVSEEGRRKRHPFTDVLIVAGSHDMEYPPKEAMESRKFYSASNVMVHVQQGKGHEMIKSKEEMRVIMEFLSTKLVRRMVSMDGLTGCVRK
ncbi:hypothetical protein ACHAXS_008922 [Conticribra weissflogii]